MRVLKVMAMGALLATSAATVADAAIIVQNANFVASPTYFNGFEGIGASPLFVPPYFYPIDAAYSEGGITVGYVGSGGFGSIWTQYPVVTIGNYSWYPDGGGSGYDKITLTGGGDFQDIQFLAGSGFGNPETLAYQLLNGASVVATGTIADIGPTPSYVGFSGGGFDEVDVQLGNIGSFTPTPSLEALSLDNIAATGNATLGIPEPMTLSIFGAGLAGAIAMRRRKRKTA